MSRRHHNTKLPNQINTKNHHYISIIFNFKFFLRSHQSLSFSHSSKKMGASFSKQFYNPSLNNNNNNFYNNKKFKFSVNHDQHVDMSTTTMFPTTTSTIPTTITTISNNILDPITTTIGSIVEDIVTTISPITTTTDATTAATTAATITITDSAINNTANNTISWLIDETFNTTTDIIDHVTISVSDPTVASSTDVINNVSMAIFMIMFIIILFLSLVAIYTCNQHQQTFRRYRQRLTTIVSDAVLNYYPLFYRFNYHRHGSYTIRGVYGSNRNDYGNGHNNNNNNNNNNNGANYEHCERFIVMMNGEIDDPNQKLHH